MADETRIQVLKEPGREPETDSFVWLFRSGEDGLPKIILYGYTETRARYNAEAFLKGFSGYLMTDLVFLLNARPRKDMSDAELEQLMPWSENARANCAPAFAK